MNNIFKKYLQIIFGWLLSLLLLPFIVVVYAMMAIVVLIILLGNFLFRPIFLES